LQSLKKNKQRRYYEPAQEGTDKRTGPRKKKAEAESEVAGKREEGFNQKEIGTK
jgi:hypothetical protein